MYNNNFMIDNLVRKKEEIEKMIQNCQTPQAPMNVFNVGTPQIDFEAKIIGKDEKPNDIMVQRKTAFICLEEPLLTIKEVNGDIKEYKIEIPKTPEQIENEELKKKISELEKELKERGNKK